MQVADAVHGFIGTDITYHVKTDRGLTRLTSSPVLKVSRLLPKRFGFTNPPIGEAFASMSFRRTLPAQDPNGKRPGGEAGAYSDPPNHSRHRGTVRGLADGEG